MGTGTLTAADGFDAIMGKKRGTNANLESERRRASREAFWALLREQGLREDALLGLSDIAVDPTPEAQAALRDILRTRIKALGMVSFATTWRDSLNFTPRTLDTAVQDVMVARCEDKDRSIQARLQDASNLIDNFFLDQGVSCLSAPRELDAHRPLVEAIGRVYRQAHQGDSQDSSILRVARTNMATCLRAYASPALHHLRAWRDELAEEARGGKLYGSALIAVESAVRGDLIRQNFMSPLIEAMEQIRQPA